MKPLNLKHAFISALMIQVIGVSAFVGSFFLPIMEDPELQANITLTLIIIPAATLGAYIYYRRGHQTNGFLLGVTMFLIAGILDALITVPLFIIPNGGDYASFFLEPGFWMIGILYTIVVVAYWQIDRHLKKSQLRKSSSH